MFSSQHPSLLGWLMVSSQHSCLVVRLVLALGCDVGSLFPTPFLGCNIALFPFQVKPLKLFFFHGSPQDRAETLSSISDL